MRNIAIVDETFDINISSTYHLFIQINNDGMCFAIMDILRNKFIAFKNLLFENSISLTKDDQVKRFLERDNHLNQNYKTSSLIYTTPNAAIIPNPLFDESRVEEIYRFSNLLPEKHTLLIRDLKCIDSKAAFAVPDKIIDMLEDHQNNFKIVHQSCPEIESASLAARQRPDETYAIVHVHPGFFDILIFQNGKFKLFNSFSFQTDQDMVFYILYVFEQFGLRTSETNLVLSGNIEENSGFTETLIQFIPHLNYNKFNKNFTYSYTFGQLNQHQFANLFNLFPCV